MRYAYLTLAFLVVLTVSVLGFRGAKSTQPPVEVFPDMDRQAKYKPQSESKFFADGRTDRPLPANVVAYGAPLQAHGPGQDDVALGANGPLYHGKNPDGSWACGFPLPVTHELMARGRERFTIFCQPCHGALGDGRGITSQYGMGGVANYHDDRLRKMTEGEIFNTITFGKNTMMAYGDKLTPGDRWAVIAYVRALQRARLGTAADVPEAHKAELGIK